MKILFRIIEVSVICCMAVWLMVDIVIPWAGKTLHNWHVDYYEDRYVETYRVQQFTKVPGGTELTWRPERRELVNDAERPEGVRQQ